MLTGNGVQIDDGADLAFLSVPIKAAMEYIERRDRTYVELSSVKSVFRKYSGSIVSIHPLFGPSSYNDGLHRAIIFVTDISNVKYKEIIEEMLRGYDLISMSAEEHDRMMVSDMVIPYLMSMIARRIEAGYHTRSFDMARSLASIVEGENPEVVMDTIRLNPFSGMARDMINDVMSVIP
ncbi:MAG: prephenate dehydrogenase/arogenate dehydrogenase family protein [Thermoplasma acidophilum]|nr:prephenate dehydrogenase/arogenate dehydrogenase family protein [Thermoplasma acidophilum]